MNQIIGSTLFLLFNHRLTERQAEDARTSLGIRSIVEPPAEVRQLWQTVAPDLPAIADYIAPVRNWLAGSASRNDHVLIQGDFGATYLMVQFAFELGLIPVYSTTKRQAEEQHGEDGSVMLTHRFRHCQFRRYGV
jgi:hypothetical protein